MTPTVYSALFIALIGLFAATDAPPSRTELRGMWVLRTTLASPASIDRMVDAASAAGINALFVQVRARGDAYYASALEPRGTLLAKQPADFDPLASIIAKSHARGIAVHAWVNVGLVSDSIGLPSSPQHIIRKHPEWLMVPRDLTTEAARTNRRGAAYVSALARWTRANLAKVEGLYVSPLHAGARAHAAAIARDLARRYAIDGLHLDYVRYPFADFDVHEPEAARRAAVTALVESMAGAAREARPGITISAAVVPDPATAHDVKLQDWRAWAARGIVDALCPMAYAEDRPSFITQVSAVQETGVPVPVWTGIGAYRLTSRETVARIQQARDAGASGIVLFSYDSVATGRAGTRYLADVARAAFRGRP